MHVRTAREGAARAPILAPTAIFVPGIEGLEISVPSGRPVRPLPEGDRYLGFLFGPPCIGFIAQAFNLRVSLGLIAVLGSMIVVMASRTKFNQ